MNLNNDIAVVRAREAGGGTPPSLGPLHDFIPAVPAAWSVTTIPSSSAPCVVKLGNGAASNLSRPPKCRSRFRQRSGSCRGLEMFLREHEPCRSSSNFCCRRLDLCLVFCRRKAKTPAEYDAAGTLEGVRALSCPVIGLKVPELHRRCDRCRLCERAMAERW